MRGGDSDSQKGAALLGHVLFNPLSAMPGQRLQSDVASRPNTRKVKRQTSEEYSLSIVDKPSKLAHNLVAFLAAGKLPIFETRGTIPGSHFSVGFFQRAWGQVDAGSVILRPVHEASAGNLNIFDEVDTWAELTALKDRLASKIVVNFMSGVASIMWSRIKSNGRLESLEFCFPSFSN
jgi:hypothetical protein